MTSMSEITRLLHRWFAEHDIPTDGFTLGLSFSDIEARGRFESALRHEIEQMSFVLSGRVSLDAFRMNGLAVRVDPPVYEVAEVAPA